MRRQRIARERKARRKIPSPRAGPQYEPLFSWRNRSRLSATQIRQAAGVFRQSKASERTPQTRRRLRCQPESVQQVIGADRKSTRLNSSHVEISYAVFCLKKKKK